MECRGDVDLKTILGIDTWRELSKEKFLQFCAAASEMDREVALQLVRQIPEITACAKAALEDAAEAYAGLLSANGQSMAAVHEFDLAVLETLRIELAKDLSAEERLRVFGEIRDLHVRINLKDTENKAFISAQFDKRLGVALTVAGSLVVLLFGVAKSASRHGGTLPSLKAA